MQPRRVILLAFAFIGLLAGIPAWAHDIPRTLAGPAAGSVPSGAAPPMDNRGLLIAALVVGIVLHLARRRRLAVALVIILVPLGFETGLHSVHHLNDPVRAAECAVAFSAVHLVGSPVDDVSVDLIGSVAHSPITPEPETQVPHPRATAHEGRAPPTSHA